MPDQFWDLTPGEFLLLRRARREESYRMARYLAFTASVMTWAEKRPSLDDFVFGSSKQQTHEQQVVALDLWAAVFKGILPPTPVNEVPA